MKTKQVQRPDSPYSQSLLAIDVWSDLHLTFSFPTKAQFTGYGEEEPWSSFARFSDGQVETVKAVLDQISSFTMLTFEQLTGGAAKNAILRFGNTDATESAFAILPAEDIVGGDSWYANQDYMKSPVPGNYAFMSIMHEVGHALGLTHPHEPAVGNPMPLDRDYLAYTIMSYRSGYGGDIKVEFGGDKFPQSYMMEDIAALQSAYGANYSSNSGDSVYFFNPQTGEMSIDGVGQGRPDSKPMLRTIWDGNGVDTYDFSRFGSQMIISLKPGDWSGYATSTSGKLKTGLIANAHLFENDKRSLIENAIGGRDDDQIFGNDAANRLEGREGYDVLYGYAGNDKLYGGADPDVLYGHAGNDLLVGGASNDRLYGGWGNDTLLGGALYDTLFGEGGDDVLRGGGGRDDMFGGKGADLLVGGGDNDKLDGGEGDDILRGNGGVDELYGFDGDDIMIGGAGDDHLDGGAGADRMVGGSGDDYYVVDDRGDRVIEAMDGGNDTLESAFDVIIGDNIENAKLSGSANTSVVGNDEDNRIVGNGGNNTLWGGGGNNIISGMDGDDIYFIDSSNDIVKEAVNSGYDIIYSSVDFTLLPGEWYQNFASATMGLSWRPGAEIEILQLTGSDDLAATGNELGNKLVGNNGDNWLKGLAGNDELIGGWGADTLNGGDDDDWISGGGNDDLLYGGKGIDHLVGGLGDDALFGQNGNDFLNGGDGDDFVNGGQGNDQLEGGNGNDELRGSAGRDLLRGDDGSDVLSGGDDFDRVVGGAGQDLIRGDSGKDVLLGGKDADIFQFAEGDFYGGTVSRADLIVDFDSSEGDVVDLSRVDAIAGGGDDAFTWIGNAEFSRTAGEIRWEVLNEVNAIAFMDIDGDGRSDYALRFAHLTNLSAEDFLL